MTTFNDPHSSWKLSAIMFSDIHSFSQKMAENETAALSLLKAYDGLMRVLCLRFGGKILKSEGDLFLIDFKSSVNAVRCALEAQQRLWSFNSDKAPLARIEIRIGIHMGDVLIQDNNVSGETVQIASLIEALAEPNRILISQDVYQQMKGKVECDTYSLGKLKLKGIQEPIEVFEVLNPAIPELSKPSRTAELFNKRKDIQEAMKRKEEEQDEARRIEEARKRAHEEQRRAEEERRRLIDELYKKAEKNVQLGNLEEAEHTLNEALKIDTSSSQQEYASLLEPKEREIREHLTKAKELLAKEQFDEAEKEVNLIFTIDPLHIEAQQVLLHIEEQRYRYEQKQRSQQVEENSFLDPNQQRIQELLSKVREHIQNEQFTEARFVLREIYRIDPNNYAARQTEEEMHLAEEARVERLKQEALRREERERQVRAQQLRKQLEEQRRKKIIKAKTHTYEEKIKLSVINQLPLKSIGLALSVIIFIFLIYYIVDVLFPKKASIAVFAPVGNTSAEIQHPLTKALPMLVAYDLVASEYITAINPTTTILFDARPEKASTLGQLFNVKYIITATAAISNGLYTITFQLINTDDSSVIDSYTTSVTPTTIGIVRTKILEFIIKGLDLKTPLPVSLDWTTSNEAASRYLLAVSKLPSTDATIQRAVARLCEAAFNSDNRFWYAAREASMLYFQLYELEQRQEDFELASKYIQIALNFAPYDPIVKTLEAKQLRLLRKSTDALLPLEIAIQQAPSLAMVHNEIALTYLMQNKSDDALKHAKLAFSYDSKNPSILFTLGLAFHSTHSFEQALNQYNTAIKLGYPELYVTKNGRVFTWLQLGMIDTLVSFHQSLIKEDYFNYSGYYRIGQAYQWRTQLREANEWLTKGLKVVQEILARDRNDAEAHAYASLFFSRLGKFTDAESEIQRALALKPDDPDILFIAARTYSIQKDIAKSTSYLRKAQLIQYRYGERFDPDFATISTTPEFINAVTF